MIKKKFEIETFKIASVCRNFELNVFEAIKNKIIKIPVYLSGGQEYISATLSTIIKKDLRIKPLIFAQHRCHSTYLSFGGNKIKLIKELLGVKGGCTNSMGGSASIHSKKINMYGHDGHMGTQVPIGIGACFTSKKPTIVFMGDASAEEDYVLGSLGWASTKKLPILFIVEDNNLSILTEKKVRRSWEIHDIGNAFGIESYNISDEPNDIKKHLKDPFSKPLLLNINTERKYWHAGAGIDGDTFDRYADEMKGIGEEALKIDNQIKNYIEKEWEKQLEKQ